MGFPRQEYWSGSPFPPPGDLPNPGIEPTSPAWAGGFFTAEPPGKPADEETGSHSGCGGCSGCGEAVGFGVCIGGIAGRTC